MLVALKLLMVFAWLCFPGSFGTTSGHAPLKSENGAIAGSPSFVAISPITTAYTPSRSTHCTYDTALHGTMPKGTVMIGWVSLLSGLRVRRQRKCHKTGKSNSQSRFAYGYNAPASIHSRHTVSTPYRRQNLHGHNYDDHHVRYYGHRYFQPETGRWVNRDPIEEVGGVNVYAFVRNDSIDAFDVMGMWRTDLHKGLTEIAASTYFTDGASSDIGKYDDLVDTDFPPTSSEDNDQNHHFNNAGTGTDSRRTVSDGHYQKAEKWCDKRLGNDFYSRSVKELGYSIHPIQDITAHGDFPGWPLPHNWRGPVLSGATGSPFDYPDDYNLDAVGSADGIPSGSTVRSSNKVTFEFGAKRFLKARADTHAMLRTFQVFCSKYCACECKKKYLQSP